MATNTSDSRYNLLSEPEDDLICLICLEVAEEPWQHGECGRLLCKKCLDELGKDQPCPNCRKAKPQYFQDSRSRRVIRALPVRCTNLIRSCDWVGNIGTLEEHVSTCGLTLLPCPKQCAAGNSSDQVFTRMELEAHLEKYCPNRDYSCNYCGESGTYAHITEIHDKLCEMKTHPCGSCSKIVQRRKILKHVKFECKESVIACKYQRLGCKVELKRADMEKHITDSDHVHLDMALGTISSLEKRYGTPITFKVTGYQEKKNNDIRFESAPFYTSPEGYHISVRVDANGRGRGKGSHLSVFACVLEGEHDQKLNWPLVGKVTFTLLNQLVDDNHLSRTMSMSAEDDTRAGNNWGYATFLPSSELGRDLHYKTQYLKDDTLYIQVTVSVPDYKPWLECTA